MKRLIIGCALLLAGCGQETTPLPPTTMTITGPVFVKDPVASGPAVSIDDAGTVMLRGELHNAYVVRCTDFDGAVAIEGLGVVQCTAGGVKTVAINGV